MSREALLKYASSGEKKAGSSKGDGTSITRNSVQGGQATNHGHVVNSNVRDTLAKYADSSNTAKKQASTSALEQYDNLQKNTATAKNEAYQAQQQALKYSDNPLKQYGLANQGYAEGVEKNINNNYMNNITGINANKAQQENDILKAYNNTIDAVDSQAKSDLWNTVSSMDYATANKYMQNELAKGNITQADIDTINKDREVYGMDWTSDRYNSMMDLINQANSANDQSTKLQYLEMANKLQNAQNESEYQNILNEMESNIKNQAVYQGIASTGNIAAANATESDFGDFMGSGNSDLKQSKYVNAMINAAKSGQLPEGAVVDMNYGAGSGKYYMYKSGVWTEVDKDTFKEAKRKNQAYTNSNAEEKGIKYKN